MQYVNNMVRLNVEAVSTLTHLFGKDMKERKRGRILMVSSVCGAVAGIPSVSVYAATKAFEKTLALSMAKELESFGVGVTCLLPGAVRGTEFRSRSNSEEALCWKLPGYPMAPRNVASVGVRAMLRGETEVMPGWMNRFFVKVLQPALPQRMHNIIAGTMWSPLRLPSLFGRRNRSAVNGFPDAIKVTPVDEDSSTRSAPVVVQPPGMLRQKFESPPRLLKLEDVSDDSTGKEQVSEEKADEEGTPAKSSELVDKENAISPVEPSETSGITNSSGVLNGEEARHSEGTAESINSPSRKDTSATREKRKDRIQATALPSTSLNKYRPT